LRPLADGPLSGGRGTGNDGELAVLLDEDPVQVESRPNPLRDPRALVLQPRR
jgi:hypothetical protein